MAAAVLIGGCLAWLFHVRSVAALLDARASMAQTLLASSPDPRRALDLLQSADVVAIAGPPPGVMPPPDFARQQPPPRLRRAGRPDWFSRMVADLAHIRPRTVSYDGGIVTLLPSAEGLARWFLVDMVVCVAGIGIVALSGWSRYRSDAQDAARVLAQREAAAAEQRRFLADAGHELRTPLTILSGYIDVLGARTSDETEVRILDGMRKASGRMRTLVEKMLLLARLESREKVASIVSIAAVSDDVAEDLRVQFPGRNIDVACDRGARIRIDENDLYEAERNLVENALRYAPESAVVVSASVRGGVAEIEVSDRGPGIPKGEQRLIFERFYRGQDRTDAEGTGLGLAIVRRVAERWNGTIALDSNAGGTRVVLRFPNAEGAA